MNKFFSRVVLLAASLVLVFNLISCDNFLSGSEIQNQVEEIITDLNAKEIQLVFDEGKTGSIKAPRTILKVGRTMEFIYNIDDKYEFHGWQIKEENDVTDDLVEVSKKETDNSYSIKILKTPKLVKDEKTEQERYAKIYITPLCKERPDTRTVTPVNEPNGISRDRAIFLEFTKEIDRKSFIFDENEIPSEAEIIENADEEIYAYRINGETFFKNIEIINSMKESLAEHYKEPIVEGKTLTIAIDKLNPIIIDSGNYEMIDVTIKKEVTDKEGVCLPKDINWHYKVIEATDEKATIIAEAEAINGVVTGIIPTEQKNRECNISQKISLNFTENSGYQFYKWEYNSSIVNIDDPGKASTTATILNTTRDVLTGEDHASIITAVCKPKLKVLSVEPAEGNVVSKNSSISIKFSEDLPKDSKEFKEVIKGIIISANSVPVKEYFAEPEIINDTIVFAADNSNMIFVDKGETKTVTVNIPQNIYYALDDGTKITMEGYGESYKYTIDDSTIEKTELKFSAPKESGTILVDGKDFSDVTEFSKFSIDQEIELSFELKEGYQFNGWEVISSGAPVAEDKIKLNNPKDKDTKLKIKVLMSGVSVVAKCSPQLTATAQIENKTVAKDSDIEIVFNKELASENNLSDIKIVADGAKADSNYKTRNFNAETKKLTIKNTTRFDIQKGSTKIITVTVPKEFYYLDSDGNKVTLGKDKEFSFTVNSTTKDKVTVYLNLINGENGNPLQLAGSFNAETTNELNLDEELNVSFTLNDGYFFQGFTYKDSNGADFTKSYLNVTSANEFEKVLVFSKPAGNCYVNVICYKKPSVLHKSPVPENALDKFANNQPIEIELSHKVEDVCKDDILVEYKGGPDGFIFNKDEYYSSEIDGTGTKITLIQKKGKTIPIKNEYGELTVTVPKNIYYLAADGKTKIAAGAEDVKWTFRINNETVNKSSFTYQSGQGKIKVDGHEVSSGVKQEYSENQRVELLYDTQDGYLFDKWSVSGIPEGYNIETDAAGKCQVKYEDEVYFEIENLNSKNTKLNIYTTLPGVVTLTGTQYLNPIASFEPENVNEGKNFDTDIKLAFNKEMNKETIKLKDTLNIVLVESEDKERHIESYFEKEWAGKTLKLKPKVGLSSYFGEESTIRTIKVTLDSSRIKDTENYSYGGTEVFTYKANGSSKTKTNMKFGFNDARVLVNEENTVSLTSYPFSYNPNRENTVKFIPNEGMTFMGWELENPDPASYEVCYSGDALELIKDDEIYFAMENIYDVESQFYLYSPIEETLNLTAYNVLEPVVTKTYAGSNTDNPIFTPTGYNCDSVVTFEFNKEIYSNSVKLTRVEASGAITPGTIDIVSLSNPNMHYEDCFTFKVTGKTIQLIPDAVTKTQYTAKRDKLKIKSLVPETDDIFEFKIILNAYDSLSISDNDDMPVNLKSNSWIYRINGNQEAEKPKINSLKIFAQKYDLENNSEGEYQEIPAYKSNTYSMTAANAKSIHVGKSIKVAVDVSDNGSGIKVLKCIEKLEKSVLYETITNQSYEHILVYPTNKITNINNTYFVEFKINKDGYVSLEFVLEDLAGNVSTEKRYVLKDTTVDETILIPANICEDSEAMWKDFNTGFIKTESSSSPYTVSENKVAGNASAISNYKLAYYEAAKPEYLFGTEEVFVRTNYKDYTNLTKEKFVMYDDTNIVLDFSFVKDTFYKTNSTTEFNSDYRMNVFYKYNKSDSYSNNRMAKKESVTKDVYWHQNLTTPQAGKTVEKTYYKIPHNPSNKETYIKIEFIDEVGNMASIERVVPRKLNVSSFKTSTGSSPRYLIPVYESLDTFKNIAAEAGAVFDILFFYTAPDPNPTSSIGTSEYTINSSTTYGVSKPRRGDQYICTPFLETNRICFSDTSRLPDEVYRPNGNYTLYFIPYFKYPDGTKYYGKLSKYDYNWNSSSPSSSPVYDDSTKEFPNSYTVEVLPAVPSKGTRTVKITLPAKKNGSTTVWTYNSNFDYGIKYYAFTGRSEDEPLESRVLSSSTGQNYMPFNVDISGSNEVTDYFELPSGYKYDICLYQKSKSGMSIYYSRLYVKRNIDLTEDNIPPTIVCKHTQKAYKYVSYPTFIKLANYNDEYKFIPEDTGYGLYDQFYPEDYEDENARADLNTRIFKYYFIKKENETWNTPQFSIEWLDEQVELGNINELMGSFDLIYDEENETYVSGSYGEVYTNISTLNMAEGYYSFVMRIMDNRMDPEGDYYYDDDESHQPNEKLLVFPISTKLKMAKSHLKYNGSNFTVIGNEDQGNVKVEKMRIAAGKPKKWIYSKNLNADILNLFNSDYSGSQFLRIHANDGNVGDSYLYSYICPVYEKYKYLHPEFELYSKSIIKTDQGYLIFADGPVMIQRVTSRINLSLDCPDKKLEGLYWLSKGDSRGTIIDEYDDMRVVMYDENVANWQSHSYTFNDENKFSDVYSVLTFTFADGTTLCGEVVPPGYTPTY